MNYLSDNVRCTLNGDDVRLAVLVEDGHVIFFHRSRKSGVISDLAVSGAGLIGVTVGLPAIPIFLVALVGAAAMDKKTGLIAALNTLKSKFKLSDSEIFISHPDRCSVNLSGKFIPLFSSCTVKIDGVFISGEKETTCSIAIQFGERPEGVAKIFRKGGFSVSVSS